MRRRRRGLLRMYYGVDDSVQLQQDNPLDIDKAGFKADMFMEKMLKETSLNNLYKQEERMKKGNYGVHNTHTLCTHTLSTHTYYPIPILSVHIPSAHTLTTIYPYPQHTHLLPYTHTLDTHTYYPIPIPSTHTLTTLYPYPLHTLPYTHTHTTCSHQPPPPHTHTSEIQELDSNMQYLVYENHSKFIKASETIREVSACTNSYLVLYDMPFVSLNGDVSM